MKYDLQQRIIAFSVKVIETGEGFKQIYIAQYLSKQLLRSGTSVALNYAEAQSGESRKDFVHKIGIALKELRETFICLQIIQFACLHDHPQKIVDLAKETDELIAIFVKSIRTAKANLDP